jgi:hypothetical protein
MSSSRRYSFTVVAGVVAAVVLPSTATATAEPGGSLLDLPLVGEQTCDGYKTIYGEALAPYMFAPLRLIGEDLEPTGQLLFPYKVTIIGEDDDALKARHLTPGETYTRPGPQPTDLVTCTFTGVTRELGPYEVDISGYIRGRGSRSL